MDDLKPCLLPCNLEQLNDRINNLSTGLTSMSSKDVMRVNKIFLTEVLNYMEELLGLRREEENRRAAPANRLLTLEEMRGMIGAWVWVEYVDKRQTELNGWYKVDDAYYDNQTVCLRGIDDDIYETGLRYETVKVYACRPQI